ncbi:diguanylate cyclase [Leptothrix cholodnii SP-6]|uniref:diguanylate cyclase n=1 Tax=Leptothrix cholodnii (strain ATCC 51168 / LMG 8142 / SP-6) TaxID=395495 RepID=B1Y2B5_LEPCP|nr:GGDEF domain-containing protein [Leptothrix cholodnii]ACB35568.1 diguanylate cyclase [Leptothrix cholodnii SP-6]
MNRELVEQALARWSAPIPPALRADFDAYHRAQSLRFLLLMNLLGQAAYVSYVAADYLVLPDIAHESARARSIFLAITLPLTLAAMRWVRSIHLLDMLLPTLILLATLIWFDLLARSQMPAVATYIYASMIFIVLANLGVRVDFLPALGLSLLISAAILHGVLRLHRDDPQAVMVFVLVYLPMLLFSLFTSWHTTLSGRRAYLHSVLDGMNRQALLQANEKLHALAQTDGLTGIANRRQFDEQAQLFWDKARQTGKPMALLIIDLDHFKAYNDHYGHQAGDDCLVRVARVLSEHMREGDYFAGRYGGEEFAVMLAPAWPALAGAVAQRLTQAVRQLGIAHAHRGDGLSVVTVSIGAALSSDDGVHGVTDLIRCSDALLYEAKRSGRNGYKVAPRPLS